MNRADVRVLYGVTKMGVARRSPVEMAHEASASASEDFYSQLERRLASAGTECISERYQRLQARLSWVDTAGRRVQLTSDVKRRLQELGLDSSDVLAPKDGRHSRSAAPRGKTRDSPRMHARRACAVTAQGSPRAELHPALGPTSAREVPATGVKGMKAEPSAQRRTRALHAIAQQREVALRRRVDRFIAAQQRAKAGAEVALKDKERSGAVRAAALNEKQEAAAQRRWDEAQSRLKALAALEVEEQEAARAQLAEALAGEARRNETREAEGKMLRESVVARRRSEEKQRAARHERQWEEHRAAVAEYVSSRRSREEEAEERRRALQRPSQADEMVARREGAARNRQRRQRDDDERAVSMASLWQRRETQVATATARRRAELDSLCQKRRTRQVRRAAPPDASQGRAGGAFARPLMLRRFGLRRTLRRP